MLKSGTGTLPQGGAMIWAEFDDEEFEEEEEEWDEEEEWEEEEEF